MGRGVGVLCSVPGTWGQLSHSPSLLFFILSQRAKTVSAIVSAERALEGLSVALAHDKWCPPHRDSRIAPALPGAASRIQK